MTRSMYSTVLKFFVLFKSSWFKIVFKKGVPENTHYVHTLIG